MELKLIYKLTELRNFFILIVPDGIETVKQKK